MLSPFTNSLFTGRGLFFISWIFFSIHARFANTKFSISLIRGTKRGSDHTVPSWDMTIERLFLFVRITFSMTITSIPVKMTIIDLLL